MTNEVQANQSAAPAVPVQPPRLIRRPQVETKTGLTRSGIYDLVKRQLFPAPVSLGGRSVAWIESEVDAWIAARIAEHAAKRAAG